MPEMIRKYKSGDRIALCDFFAGIIEQHKEYISHGEIQMGVAIDSRTLAPDFKEIWLKYLDRQLSDPENILLIAGNEGNPEGFILFGIARDSGKPYGVIFDLAVAPELRGKHIGSQLLKAAVAELRTKGIRDCYLESGSGNHSAHDFFERYGFRHVSNIYRMEM